MVTTFLLDTCIFFNVTDSSQDAESRVFRRFVLSSPDVDGPVTAYVGRNKQVIT